MARFADYIAEEKSKTAAPSGAKALAPQPRDPLDDELDALRAKVAKQDAETGSSHQTTTATNAQEANAESARAAKENLARSQAASSFGFGVARGGTLGLVDRAVGLGTTIGERLAASPQNPADPDAGVKARADYLNDEDKAAKASPGMHMFGEFAGGTVPTLATGGLNRFAQAATLGGVAGAGNTVSNEPWKLAKGAALGAGGGLAIEGTLGSLFRAGTRKAPEREDKTFMREITRTQGGEGVSAMLRRNKEELVREQEGLMAARQDPEIREAVKMTEGKGIPTINKKIEPFAEENANLYDILDHKATTGPAGSNHVGLMTAGGLADALEKAKDNVSAEAAMRLEGIKRDLTDHIVPRMWKGEEVIPTARLREWLTSVQDSAGRVPGSLNETTSYETTMEASREAKRIVNDYLDSIGAPDVVAQIRANNESMRPLITIRNAMKAKSKKEVLDSMGLSQVAEQQTRKLELGAALAAAASGHPEAGAAIVARPYAQNSAVKGLHAVNENVLDPLERAARAGKPLAVAARSAIEAVPQVGGRTVEPIINPQQPLKPPASTIRQAFGNPDYRTSTDVR